MVPGEFGHLSQYREVTGTPEESKEEEAAKVGAPPKPNPNWEGDHPLSFSPSPSSFFSYSN